MVRISDGRMSGTAAGTIVLHVTPESAIGGPLAHVRSGDRIRLSVTRRELTLLVPAEELARRAAENPITPPTAERGYRKLFLESVTQADKGVGLRFPARAGDAREGSGDEELRSRQPGSRRSAYCGREVARGRGRSRNVPGASSNQGLVRK